jgi:hypothetical protein
MSNEAASQKGSEGYDYVGQLHNRFLDRLKATAIELRSVKESADANEMLGSFLKENAIPLDRKTSVLLDSRATWSQLSDAIPEVDGLLRNGDISKTEHKYLRAVMDNLRTLDRGLSTALIQRSFREIELLVQSDAELADSRKALLLSSISVARHSLDYWVRELKDGSSIWLDPADMDVSSEPSTIAKGVVGKDVVGAVQGAAVGSAGGTPASTAGGAIVGAIRGSAGGAIKKGVKALWGKIKGLF